MVPAASGWVPRAPPYSGSRCFPSALRLRGSHPLRPAFPCRSAALPFFLCGPTTPARGLVWPPPVSLAATPGITFVLFSSGYSDVSLPRVLLPFGMHPHCGMRVSPFGHRRILALLQLPGAFRRSMRPSSPARA